MGILRPVPRENATPTLTPTATSQSNGPVCGTRQGKGLCAMVAEIRPSAGRAHHIRSPKLDPDRPIDGRRSLLHRAVHLNRVESVGVEAGAAIA